MRPLSHAMEKKVELFSVTTSCFNVWLDIPKSKCKNIVEILDEYMEAGLM
jgi:hypothetical protein